MITVVWIDNAYRIQRTFPILLEKRALGVSAARNQLVLEDRKRLNALLASEVGHEAHEATLLTNLVPHRVDETSDIHLHLAVTTRGSNQPIAHFVVGSCVTNRAVLALVDTIFGQGDLWAPLHERRSRAWWSRSQA